MEYTLIWFPTYVLVGMLDGIFRFNQMKKLIEKGRADELTGKDKEKYDELVDQYGPKVDLVLFFKPLVIAIFALFWLPLELYPLFTAMFDNKQKKNNV